MHVSVCTFASIAQVIKYQPVQVGQMGEILNIC